MKVYAKLVKRKDEALSVFRRAKESLEDLHASLVDEHGKCADVIKEEVDKQQYLEGEMAQVFTSLDRVKHVLGE